ncbi:efflux RND transporter periplasmic adaptor subunit [Pseudorhodobacter sp. W20_MBD10_FR17]|uniref:efflux RND transporter periplasmic adaptor subunit n=1 Tax=Pseudorhodobacter sp. W20_MBD10_FR17 TaxID=3240266 RepID=UPI003F96776D
MTQDPKTVTPELPLEDSGMAHAGSVSQPKPRSKLLYIPVVMALLFTGAVVGMYFQPPALRAFFGVTGLQPGAGSDTPIAVAIQKVKSQEVVAVISEGDVVALGRVIPKGDVVSVATPSGAGDARLAELRVKVGQTVAKGDVLAVLDNLSTLENGVATARATIVVREATLAQTTATIRASRDEAQAALDRAEATAKNAQSDMDRVASLFERGVATRADLDQAVATAAEAGRDVERAIATLSRYQNAEATQADIAVAEANLAAARVDLTRAEQMLDSAYVRAPSAGTVLDINARAGERPSGGIIDLGDTSQMTVEAEVYQTLIGRVAIGDPVTVSAEALLQDLTGSVTAIGLEIGRQSITSDDPAANTDARVVDVIVTLDEGSSALAKGFTHLETIVRIDAGRVE